MTYGLVDDSSSLTEIAVMKSKKIPEGNIATISQTGILFSRLNIGDTIWLITVADFPSVTRFVAFADAVLHTGVVLRIVNESYLEVGNGKHWRASVREHMNTLISLEQAGAGKLHNSFVFTAQGRRFVDRCIGSITIGILAKTYASDGILHRG